MCDDQAFALWVQPGKSQIDYYPVDLPAGSAVRVIYAADKGTDIGAYWLLELAIRTCNSISPAGKEPKLL